MKKTPEQLFLQVYKTLIPTNMTDYYRLEMPSNDESVNFQECFKILVEKDFLELINEHEIELIVRITPKAKNVILADQLVKRNTEKESKISQEKIVLIEDDKSTYQRVQSTLKKGGINDKKDDDTGQKIKEKLSLQKEITKEKNEKSNRDLKKTKPKDKRGRECEDIQNRLLLFIHKNTLMESNEEANQPNLNSILSIDLESAFDFLLIKNNWSLTGNLKSLKRRELITCVPCEPIQIIMLTDKGIEEVEEIKKKPFYEKLTVPKIKDRVIKDRVIKETLPFKAGFASETNNNTGLYDPKFLNQNTNGSNLSKKDDTGIISLESEDEESTSSEKERIQFV